jgi:hypothetical protein
MSEPSEPKIVLVGSKGDWAFFYLVVFSLLAILIVYVLKTMSDPILGAVYLASGCLIGLFTFLVLYKKARKKSD